MRSLVLLVFFMGSCQSTDPGEWGPQFSGEAALEHIKGQLAFGPRYPGSPGHASTQLWLVESLTELGWIVELQEFDYKGTVLTNIIANHPYNNGPAQVLLGAHYDTRRYADRDPLQPTLPVPGANDGASGVAVLLELARVFSHESPVDLVLVFFDGEDQGRIDEWDWAVGAAYFVDNYPLQLRVAVIVDMVGDEDLSLPYERSSDEALVQSIWSTAGNLGISAFRNEPGPSIIDDHIPFLQSGIPAVDIIDFTYPYWHTTDDNIEHVSSQSLLAVGATLEYWLWKSALVDLGITQ